MAYPGWENYAGPTPKAKRSRLGVAKVTYDGMSFDSKREAARYQDLALRLKAGDIRRLRRQPRYALCPLVIESADVRDINAGEPSVRRVPVADYIADFEYEECDMVCGGIAWKVIVEDVKGVRTDIYKLKKKWFEAQYGIQIREVTSR